MFPEIALLFSRIVLYFLEVLFCFPGIVLLFSRSTLLFSGSAFFLFVVLVFPQECFFFQLTVPFRPTKTAYRDNIRLALVLFRLGTHYQPTSIDQTYFLFGELQISICLENLVLLLIIKV